MNFCSQIEKCFSYTAFEQFIVYYFSISVLFFDITSASVCKAAVNAVPELINNVLKKVLKNALKYILSTYVLST